MLDRDFFIGKRVLVTGHTGFKGTWLCKVLIGFGASVIGYGLEPKENEILFELSNIKQEMTSIIGDIRDLDKLKEIFVCCKPHIVIHMAAQPLVREGYANPVYTYDVNVMGTVNVLECVRICESVKAVINVTTDKVYKNREWEWGYREYEELNGYDPYSNSKSCSELVTSCYINSYLKERGVAVSTVRAGNVIGGGDFSKDRIIPDCVRAATHHEDVKVRNPYSVRPYQHVLEALSVYLLIAEKSYCNIELAGNYNVGPRETDCITTGELVKRFFNYWNGKSGYLCDEEDEGPHEATTLKLDCSKLKTVFGWSPVWNVDMAIKKTVEWSKHWVESSDVSRCMDAQIEEFFQDSLSR